MAKTLEMRFALVNGGRPLGIKDSPDALATVDENGRMPDGQRITQILYTSPDLNQTEPLTFQDYRYLRNPVAIVLMPMNLLIPNAPFYQEIKPEDEPKCPYLERNGFWIVNGIDSEKSKL